MNSLKELFLLDPNVVFLNHGSFGATPRPVFAAYQTWQRRLERQPVAFFLDELPGHLADARQELGRFLNAGQDDLVYVPNATFGVNVVARSLDLGPGDEVLMTDHEYGACQNVWDFLSCRQGFEVVQQSVSFPAVCAEAILEELWQGVSPRTRVIFVSHISSPTALRLPVAAICARAREAGILTIVDGAHAPGQIPLDLKAINADFYTGNAHKWLCAPKGSAFLYARPERQRLIEPLVVGWGWGPERTFTFGSDYLDYLQWLGTNDLSAYLTVSDAIRFQEQHDWPAVRQRCHELLALALRRVGELTGLAPLYRDDGHFRQMAVAPLPPLKDAPAFKDELYRSFRVEIPCTEWQGRHFIRISVQGYNSYADIEALLRALRELLPQHVAT